MTFIFRFKPRRGLFWRSRKVVGCRLDKDIDRMFLYFQDGGIEELSAWSGYDARLGTDWVHVTHKNLEQKAGQAIPLNVG